MRKYRNLLGASIFLLAIILNLIAPSLKNTAGAVADQITVIDKGKMIFRGREYTDADPLDSTYQWVYGPASCRNTLEIDNFNDNSKVIGNVQIRAKTTDSFGKESCNDQGSKITNISLVDAFKRFWTAYRIDSDNIFVPVVYACHFSGGDSADNTPTYFRRPAASERDRDNRYYLVNDTGSLDSSKKTYLDTTPDGTATMYKPNESNGGESESRCGDFTLANSGRATAIPSTYGVGTKGKPPTTTTTSQTPTSTAVTDSCDSQGGVLSWVLCPIIKILDSATSTVDGVVRDQLETRDPNASDPRLKQTWGRIRNIALVSLIPVMLIMVIGTALNFSFVDAYTVKRAMPRFLLAVIFISLSWYVTSFLINITDVAGRGILGLISQPFGVADKTLADFIRVGNGQATSGLVVFGGLFAVAAGQFSLGIAFSFIMIAAVAIFLGFFILVIRQILIIGLVLLAPLAILSWIFPNNDQIWKLWWGTFSKLLLMFPIIMLLIGAGRIGASVIPIQQNSNSFFTNILVIIAYISPYFFIPATFKFAGGIFANLAGVINDRGRGFFDKQREGRTKQRQELHSRAGANRRFNPANRFTSRFNSAASWAAAPLDNAAYYGRKIPGLSGRGEKIKSQIEGATVDQTGKLFQELNNMYGSNDKAYRALMGGHDQFTEKTRKALIQENLYGRAPTSVAEVQKIANIMADSDSDTERIGANALRTSAGRLGSLYSDPEMLKANWSAAGMMGLAAHGFAGSADLAQFGNRLIDGGVSQELAHTLVSRAQIAGQGQRPDIKAGYGITFDKDGRFVDGLSPEGGRAEALIETLSAQDLAAAKSGAMKKLAPHISSVIQRGSGSAKARIDAGVGTAEDMKAYGKAQAMKDQLFSWAGPYSQASVDAKRQALELIRDTGLQDEFDSRRRAETDPTLRGQFPGGGGHEDVGPEPPPQ